MKKLLVLMAILSLNVSCSGGGSGSPNETQSLKRVLIIGDSISIGYTPYVAQNLLEYGYRVEHNAGNAQTSANGVTKIDLWLNQNGADKWDLITFNHGLWDINRLQVPLNEYIDNMRIIATKVKAKSVKCVFITSTFTVDGRSARVTADTVVYNNSMLTLMDELEIPVIELYSYAQSISYLIYDDAHFTEEGYSLLADEVSRQILTLE